MPDLNETLLELGVYEFLDGVDFEVLAKSVSAEGEREPGSTAPTKLVRYGHLFEVQAVQLYSRGLLDPEDLAHRSPFEEAFTCWTGLAEVGTSTSIFDTRTYSDVLAQEVPDEILSPYQHLAFHIAATGLGSQRVADVRLRLTGFDLQPSNEGEWHTVIASHIASAVCALSRKHNGWEDVDDALGYIDVLRARQAEYESDYLGRTAEQSSEVREALRLLAFYHLAQMVTVTGTYLKDGQPDVQAVRLALDRHRSAAQQALQQGQWTVERHFSDLAWVACHELANNCIWTHASGLGQPARDFVALLTASGQSRPVIELWPSQQEALKHSLLDPYRRAVLVEMPTSAGKTLLAKFSIVQTLALNPESTIAYIVPTRALVNQVTRDLRSDVGQLGYRVEQAVPAYELDPLEDSLLSDRPSVIVTTPEKLDFLVRRSHESVGNLSLVVADEAHSLGDGARGARLELLLAMVQRERPGARFLLLSPFLPNDEELVRWLGRDRALPPIKVEWRPTKRVTGALDTSGRQPNRKNFLETMPSVGSLGVPAGEFIPVGPPAASRTVKELSTEAAVASAVHGGVLVLCRGRGTANKRALGIAERLDDVDGSPLRHAVERYAAAEMGPDADLVRLLKKGVAYHHSGLPSELRWLVESLVKSQDVKVVTGTTTLAAGVNFPIRTVIIEDLKKGTTPLSYSDFWNIAGRAGRALLDQVGIVMHPTGKPERKDAFEQFLRGEAEEVSSQLAGLIVRADEIAGEFNLAQIRSMPELSSFLQFLAHAVRISGRDSLADQVEDLLRSSLVYQQARVADEAYAEKLVSLARSYINHVSGNRNILPLADKTGFSTPSVLWLMAQRDNYTTLNNESAWAPDVLFGGDLLPLTERVSAVADVPEIRLGEGAGSPFNPERVARILRDWVRGRPLVDMAQEYGTPQSSPGITLSEFSRYLFSTVITQASWGLGALETMTTDGDFEADDPRAYVPSMVYFGVDTPEAVWLRMVGVPRFLAQGLSEEWTRQGRGVPQSHTEIRDWVGSLDDAVLSSASGTALTTEDVRMLWAELAG